MMKRICLKCALPNFSADSAAEFWTCLRCGAQIGVEAQVPAEGKHSVEASEGSRGEMME